jgi:hypothetical protein
MRTRRIAAATAAALVAIGLGVVLAGCTPHPTEALSKLAHLDHGTMLAADQDPPLVPGADSDIVPSTLRMMLADDGTQFWVGVTTADDVCFIAETSAAAVASAGVSPGLEPAGGSAVRSGSGRSSSGTTATVLAADGSSTTATCISAEHFGYWGATLHLGAQGTRYWLHTEYMRVGDAWTSLSANIAVLR